MAVNDLDRAASLVPPMPGHERIRIAGLACGILLWSTYAYMVWTPNVLDRYGVVKGWDFPQFYVMGRFVLEERPGSLSDGRALANRAAELIAPTLDYLLVPVYGPQVALLFAPFASLPYGLALACWIVISLAIYLVCCALLWRSCLLLKPHGVTMAIAAAGSPALFLLICYGQLSAIALASVTAGLIALRADRPVVAGLALGCLAYKPPLGLAIAVVFLWAREWRMVGAAAGSAVAQFALAWAYAGTAVMEVYLWRLTHPGEIIALVQQKQHLLQSLWPFFSVLFRSPRLAVPAYLLVSLLVLARTRKVWQSTAPLALRYSMLLLATVLVSPHIYVYDLVILAPVYVLLGGWLLSRAAPRAASSIVVWLVLLYVAPLLGPIVSYYFGLQPSVIVIAAIWAVLSRHAANDERTAPVVNRHEAARSNTIQRGSA